MTKLLHSLIFWLVMFCLGSGLALWFLLAYLGQWYRLNPGYLDVMASAVITALILPFFITAAFIVLRAAASDLPTYVQLALVELIAKAPARRAKS